jgi:phosphoribosylaminoimidazole-succinocarboxamide synthase
MNGIAPIVVDPRLLERTHAVTEPEVPGAQVYRHGKVRTVFHAGPDHFVIVASDRLSAYDSVLPTPIPGKGAILSLISAFWMRHSRPPRLTIS